MTTDLRPMILRNEQLINANAIRLESNERHQLLARMKRVGDRLNELDVWRHGLHIGALPANDVTDGEDDAGNVRPMGTLVLELTGFAEDFELGSVADALAGVVAGLLKGKRP